MVRVFGDVVEWAMGPMQGRLPFQFALSYVFSPRPPRDGLDVAMHSEAVFDGVLWSGICWRCAI